VRARARLPAGVSNASSTSLSRAPATTISARSIAIVAVAITLCPLIDGYPCRVHEHEAGVRRWRRRRREQRSGHVEMTARLEDQRSPIRVRMAPPPVALLHRRLSCRHRYALDDEAERLAADMRVDCLDDSNHRSVFGFRFLFPFTYRSA
jgi:hypothetical protein